MDEYEEKFNSIDELYKKLLPALNTKVAELKREKINLTNKEIWEYCLKNKWQNRQNLRIYELVEDILNIDTLRLEIYYNKKRGID